MAHELFWLRLGRVSGGLLMSAAPDFQYIREGHRNGEDFVVYRFADGVEVQCDKLDFMGLDVRRREGQREFLALMERKWLKTQPHLNDSWTGYRYRCCQ